MFIHDMGQLNKNLLGGSGDDVGRREVLILSLISYKSPPYPEYLHC